MRPYYKTHALRLFCMYLFGKALELGSSEEQGHNAMEEFNKICEDAATS